jgi:fatty acid desaturase
MLLGFVFIQSHNGMEVFNDKRDFMRAQLASTRNVSGGLFNDWFTGGLNRQIEHHLFPTLPRHNLRKAQKRVYALCSKHGLYYEVSSVACVLPTVTCTQRPALRRVAR